MSKINDKTISSVYDMATVISKIYKGALLVYGGWKDLITSGVPPLILSKCKNDFLLDYKIYGNSVQNGTPTPDNPIEVESVGDKTKNLLDIDVGLNEQLTKEDGIYILTKGESVNRFSEYINVDLKAGVTYTISCDYIDSTPTDNNLVLQFQLTYADGTNNHYWSISKSNTAKVYTLDGDVIRMRIYMDGTLPVGSYTKFKNLQIVEGETPTEFEPCGYKIPIISRSKNLINNKDLIIPNVDYENWEITETGFRQTKNYANGYIKRDIYNITNLVKPNQTIYLHVDIIRNFNVASAVGQQVCGGLRIYVDDVNTTNIYYGQSPDKTYTLPETFEKVTIVMYTVYGNSSIENFDPNTEYYIEWKNLYLSTEPYTKYDSYKEPIKINIYLNEPLRKIGDYVDYIDFKNRKVVRNVFEYVFEGNEFSNKPFNDLGTTVRAYTRSLIDGTVNNFVGLSEKGIFDGKSTAGGDAERCQYAYVEATQKSAFYARILKSRCVDPNNPTATDLNNIYNKGTKIYGGLSIPIEQSIELPKIPTHKDTTVLEIDTSVNSSYIEAVYKGKGKLQLLDTENNDILNSILDTNTNTELDITNTEINQILDKIIGG